MANLYAENLYDLEPQKEPELSEVIGNSLKQELMKGLNTYGKYAIRQPLALGAGFAEGLTGLLNLPHKAANAISPKLGEIISPLPNHDYMKMFGVEDPNIGEELIRTAGSYIPSSLGGGAALGTKLGAAALSKAPLLAKTGRAAVEGGLYGASMDEEGKSLENAAETSAINAGLQFVPGAFGKIFKRFPTAPQKIEKEATKIKDYLKSGNEETVKQAFPAAKRVLNDLRIDEKNAWRRSERLAKQADESKVPFDKNYLKVQLEDKLANLKQGSAEYTGEELANASSIAYLEKMLAKDVFSTKNYEGAMRFRKSLNKVYKKEVPKENQPSLDTLNYIKDAFKNSMQKNIEKNGMQKFGQQWEKANALTKEKNEVLFDLDTAKGKKVKTAFARLSKEEKPTNPETFVNEYLPKSGEIGLDRFKQLAKTIGDEDLAKNILKEKIYGNIFKNNKTDAEKFIKTYFDKGAISAEQNAYLFTPEQRKTIDKLNTIYKEHPKLFKDNKIMENWIKHQLFGFLPSVWTELRHGGQKLAEKGAEYPAQYFAKSLAAELRKSGSNNKKESSQ